MATTEAQRFALLRAIGEVADGTRLLGETVQRLLDVIVPEFADVATFDVAGPTGELRRLGARVDRPRDPALEAALLARHQSGDVSVGVMHTLRSTESQLLAPITDETLRAIAANEDDLDVLRSLHLNATIYVPLSARGRTLGVLACSTRAAERSFGHDDLRFAEVLAGRIGLALDNAGLSETVSGLERRLEATLANLAAGVIVRDRAGDMVFANAAASDLLGLRSVEEVFAASSEELMALFDAYDEDGRPLSLEELPSARALRGEHPAPMVVRSLHRSQGRTRWLLHKATPVFEPDGTVGLAVNILEDITESKRAEIAQRLLADVSRELSASLDYEETLARVARLAVPELADWCGVSILGPGETLEQVAVAHVDPAKVALARDWGQRYPTRLDNPSGAAEAIRSGRPQMVAEVSDELMAALDATEEQRRLAREVGLRSVIIVPLVVAGQPPFGVLSLVMAESGRRFAEEDLEVAEELGRRAATAVENARLYTERARVAAILQHSLLPPDLPDVPGFHLASLYRPAGAGNEVGGDFYDAFAVPEGWLVVVGDVTGHGVAAAALTALSRHTLRTAARLLSDPVRVVEQLNLALLEQPELALVSVCIAQIRATDGGTDVDILLAGHPPAYHVRSRRAVAVGYPAQLLGFDDLGRWSVQTVALEPGDLLVLYTDGVIDAYGEGDRFGEQRLEETLRGARDAQDAVGRIERALGVFARGAQRDDTAVLALQRVGVTAAAPGVVSPRR